MSLLAGGSAPSCPDDVPPVAAATTAGDDPASGPTDPSAGQPKFLVKATGRMWQITSEIMRQLLASGAWASVAPSPTEVDPLFHLLLGDRGRVNYAQLVGRPVPPTRSTNGRTQRVLVNSYRGCNDLTNKSALCKTMRNYALEHGLSASELDYLPTTFVLRPGDVHDERALFLAEYDRQQSLVVDGRKNAWIAKANRGAKGSAIFVSDDAEKLIAYIDARASGPSDLTGGAKADASSSSHTMAATASPAAAAPADSLATRAPPLRSRLGQHSRTSSLLPSSPAVDSWVLQRYIDRPFLLDGRKFDIRCWILVDAEYRIYMYRNGVCRMSSTPYNLDDLSDEFVHLTNHCLAAHTLISLANNTTKAIQDVQVGDQVLGISQHDELVPRAVTAVLQQGVKACLQLTFLDGRQLTCTPDHRLMRSDGVWVEAKDLRPDVDAAKVGPRYGALLVDADRTMWSLQLAHLGLTLRVNDAASLAQSVAFFRLLGYLMTDGSIDANVAQGGHRAKLYLGHMIDWRLAAADLQLLTGEPAGKAFMCNHTYVLVLGAKFAADAMALDLKSGKRGQIPRSIPKVLTTSHDVSPDWGNPADPDAEHGIWWACPLPIVRAFLSGLFGGDGKTVSLGHRGRGALTCIGWWMSTAGSAAAEQARCMKDELGGLLRRLDIEVGQWSTSWQTTNVTAAGRAEVARLKRECKPLSGQVDLATVGDTNPDLSVLLRLELSTLATTSFAEQIGFAYCCHKQQRLEEAAAIHHTWRFVLRQRLALAQEMERTTSIGRTMAKRWEDAKQTLSGQGRLHPAVLKWNPKQVNQVTQGATLQSVMKAEHLSANALLAAYGAKEFFSEKRQKKRDNAATDLPTFFVPLLDVREVGDHAVYDLVVPVLTPAQEAAAAVPVIEVDEEEAIDQEDDMEEEKGEPAVSAAMDVDDDAEVDERQEAQASFLANGVAVHNCIQERHPAFARQESGNEVFFDQLQTYLDRLPVDESTDAPSSASSPPSGVSSGRRLCVVCHLLPQLHRVVSSSLSAVRPSMASTGDYHSFQLFGFDFMLTDQFQVQLLEINATPASADKLLEPIVRHLIERAVMPIVAPEEADSTGSSGTAPATSATGASKAPADLFFSGDSTSDPCGLASARVPLVDQACRCSKLLADCGVTTRQQFFAPTEATPAAAAANLFDRIA